MKHKFKKEKPQNTIVRRPPALVWLRRACLGFSLPLTQRRSLHTAATACFSDMDWTVNCANISKCRRLERLAAPFEYLLCLADLDSKTETDLCCKIQLPKKIDKALYDTDTKYSTI